MEIETIVAAVVSALGGGGIGGFVGWRAKKRQDNANAAKTEAEAKGDQIENIEKMVEKAYKPIIEDLTLQIQKLQAKVDKLDADKDRLNERIDELEEENRKLRSALRKENPDLVPNVRSEQASKQARGADGRFIKQEEPVNED